MPTAVRRSQLTNDTGVSDLNIENTNIKTASGVSLDEQQTTLVGSVLDVSVDHRTSPAAPEA